MTEPSPTLAEFLPRYQADDNEWWRLSSGDMQNLFDEAVDEIERLIDEIELLRRALRRACNDGWADGEGAMASYLNSAASDGG